VDLVLGAFDAVVTVEGEGDDAIEEAVASISKARGVKEAKPLVEIKGGTRGDLPVLGAAPSAPRRSHRAPTA
jgi:hypothetical protein